MKLPECPDDIQDFGENESIWNQAREATVKKIKVDVMNILDSNYRDRVALWEKLKAYFEEG